MAMAGHRPSEFEHLGPPRKWGSLEQVVDDGGLSDAVSLHRVGDLGQLVLNQVAHHHGAGVGDGDVAARPPGLQG